MRGEAIYQGTGRQMGRSRSAPTRLPAAPSGHGEVDRPGQPADQCSRQADEDHHEKGQRERQRRNALRVAAARVAPRRTGRWRTRRQQLLRPRRALRTGAEPCAAAQAAFVATVRPASRDNYDRCSAMRPELLYSGACTSSPGRGARPWLTSSTVRPRSMPCGITLCPGSSFSRAPAQPLIRAERLALGWGERALVNVVAGEVAVAGGVVAGAENCKR